MKVALFYTHAASNWGDLAINKGVVNLLESAGHSLEKVHGVRLPHNMVHTLNSDVSLNHIRVIPVAPQANGTSNIGTLSQAYEYLTDIRRFITDFEIDGVDMILLNSGEHLYESADGSNIGDLAWRMLPLVAGAHAHVPVVQLPTTVGPFHTQRITKLFRRFLYNLDSGAVRDDFSSKLVSQFEGPLERVLDPGFFGVDRLLSETDATPKKAIALLPRLEDFGLRAGSRRSAFVLAKNREEGYGGSQAFQVYYRLAKNILESSSDMIHLIIQTWADRELLQNLYTALSELDQASRVSLHDPTDYDTFTDSLVDVDVVVTSRFHAAILALTQGVPAVGTYSDSHGHKMPGLFSMLGFPENAVRIQDRIPDAIVSEILQSIEFSRENSARIYDSVVSWREFSETWFRRTIAASAPSPESSKLPNLQEVDQLRIDLLAELHSSIISLNCDDNYKSILGKLRNIENRLVKTDKE